MKIAIVAWGAMADVLYATPIVRQIRKIHPGDNIVWHVRDKFADVVKTNPHIDGFVEWELPEGYASRQEAEYVMDQKIMEYVKANCDKVYDLQYWPRHTNFFEKPTEDFISLRARNAGIDPSTLVDRSIVLSVTDQDVMNAASFVFNHLNGKRFITVNHISYAARAIWSFDKYQSLTDRLNTLGISSAFTGAPNEPIPHGAVDARGMPYREWAQLIRKSSLWLGLDSGAVALACSTPTPIIKLHSPDFPLAKTGIKAMGLRTVNVMELYPAPTVDSVVDMIQNMIQ